MSSITVGIAGITGKFARLLALRLVAISPQVKLRGLARDPSKIDASPLRNVELYQGDAFEADKVRRFVRGTDVVVCCYLGDDHLMIEGQKVLIDIAEEEHVPRYIASDWSLDWTKLEMGELFAKEPCQRIHAYLAEKKSIQGIHILIGGFTDVLYAPFFQIWDQHTLTFNYWGTGDEVWECTSYMNSAQYTAAVCLDPEAVGVLRCKVAPVLVSTYVQKADRSSRWRCDQYQGHGERVREGLRQNAEPASTWIPPGATHHHGQRPTKIWSGLL